MIEIWKQIDDFSAYEVSNLGRVRRGVRVMKPSHQKSGYLQVALSLKNVRHYCYVHRLVLEAFVGPCPEGEECRHKDDVSSHNELTNLLWGTPKMNAADRCANGKYAVGEDHPIAVLTVASVLMIRASIKSTRRLAKELGV